MKKIVYLLWERPFNQVSFGAIMGGIRPVPDRLVTKVLSIKEAKRWEEKSPFNYFTTI